MKFKEGDIIKGIGTPSSEWHCQILETKGGEYVKAKILRHDNPSLVGHISSFEGYSYVLDEDCEIDTEHIVGEILKKYEL